MKRARDLRVQQAKEEKKARKAAAAAAAGSPLDEALFEPARVAALRAAYAAAAPFPHVVVEGLCDPARAKLVEQEARTSLRADFKETDLFKVYQTPDLANLGLGDGDGGDGGGAEDDGRLKSTVAAASSWVAPQLVALRDAIYSDRFRALVSELSGCGPLEPKADCSCNAYVEGGHLLCHDDVINTRRVSYIIYLNDPSRPWTAVDGGALELYPLSPLGVGHPATTPTKNVLPAFNQMVLFTVVPGVSFHAVQEVFAVGRPRLSISGWFHGKAPPPGMEHATRAQLQGPNADPTNAIAPWVSYSPGKAAGGNKGDKGDDKNGDEEEDNEEEDEDLGPVELSAEDVATLSPWVNPQYLDAAVLGQLRARFLDPLHGSSVQLSEFLKPDVARRLSKALRAADARDFLGAPRNGLFLDDEKAGKAAASASGTSGTNGGGGGGGGSESTSACAASLSGDVNVGASPVPYGAGVGGGWEVCGPVHKQRFLRFGGAASSSDGGAAYSTGASDGVFGGGDGGDDASLLDAVRAGVVATPAFRRWLFQVTRLTALQGRCLTRRFRPGLDYTVAHAGSLAAEAALDATLCFVDDDDSDDGEGGGEVEKDGDAEKKKGGKTAKGDKWNLWDSGEAGGFECYVEAEDEGAPEVYQQAGNEARDAGEGATAVRSKGGGGDDEEEDSESEDEGSGGTLLSVQGRCNTLSLVMRDPGVMRFVKYVSASAPGSRWDVSAEFTVE